MPMAIDFGDAGANAGSWTLDDVQQVDCNQGTPNGQPNYNPDHNTVEWVVSSGGGGTNNPPPVDPNAPLPIDEGMPTDLSPMDAFFWMMENRIGTKIYFSDEEKEVIREYTDLRYSIGNYVQEYNQKPNGLQAFRLRACWGILSADF